MNLFLPHWWWTNAAGCPLETFHILKTLVAAAKTVIYVTFFKNSVEEVPFLRGGLVVYEDLLSSRSQLQRHPHQRPF